MMTIRTTGTHRTLIIRLSTAEGGISGVELYRLADRLNEIAATSAQRAVDSPNSRRPVPPSIDAVVAAALGGATAETVERVLTVLDALVDDLLG